ncbi:MAG: hypothetical protein AAF556_05950, partial [Pseudomonadota bacterium]
MDEAEFVALSADLADVLRDASILVWQTKYTHWTQRPSMRRPDLLMHIGNPPFPGYVSGHATMSAAASSFLAARDPQHAVEYINLATDAANSRFFGGVHPPSDNHFGQQLGVKVARQHLGLPIDPSYRANPWSSFDLLAVTAANAVLDWTAGLAVATARATTAAAPRFRRVIDDTETWLPVPAPKGAAPETYEGFFGSIAVRDLDGDEDGDILISGYQKARLYENLGGFRFRLAREFAHPELVGAYFTHDRDGSVSGVLAFGYAAPRWFPAAGGFDFGDMEQIAGADDHAWHSFGLILEDKNGDGVEDLVFLNYSETNDEAGIVDFSPEGKPNLVALWTGASFEIDHVIGTDAATFAGGKIDIDQDGIEDLVLVNDAKATEIISGADAQPIELSDRAALPLAGMSFTPVRLGQNERFGIHISNIYDLDQTTGVRREGVGQVEEANADFLLVYDPERSIVFDMAAGQGLQEDRLEWSWGSAAGDVNGDGFEDLVVSEGYVPSSRYRCGLRLMVQQADASFIPMTQLAGLDTEGFCPRSAVLEDLDGDQDLDLIIANGFGVQLFENRSDRPPGLSAPSWAGMV